MECFNKNIKLISIIVVITISAILFIIGAVNLSSATRDNLCSDYMYESGYNSQECGNIEYNMYAREVCNKTMKCYCMTPDYLVTCFNDVLQSSPSINLTISGVIMIILGFIIPCFSLIYIYKSKHQTV